MASTAPVISVVIATRDRPELLERALRSIAIQGGDADEVILVDNSDLPESRARNAKAAAMIVPRAKLLALPHGGRLGPGVVRNRGMAEASGDYLAFLDDDDEWIDPHYLRLAARAVADHGLDLLFADQMAVRPDGLGVAGPVWAEDLASKLPAAGVTARDGVYLLSAAQVLLSDGFAHLNTTVIRRSFALGRLGGFDPAIDYEEDRDLYLRAIDAAAAIGYMPLLVARHHVPEGRPSASSISTAEREACRLLVLSKGVEQAAHPAIRERCRRDRGMALRKASTRAAGERRFRSATELGRAALRDRWSWKWAAYLAALYACRAVRRRSAAD